MEELENIRVFKRNRNKYLECTFSYLHYYDPVITKKSSLDPISVVYTIGLTKTLEKVKLYSKFAIVGSTTGKLQEITVIGADPESQIPIFESPEEIIGQEKWEI